MDDDLEPNGAAMAFGVLALVGALGAGGYWIYARQKKKRRCEEMVGAWEGIASQTQKQAAIKTCVNTPSDMLHCFGGEGFEQRGCESVAQRMASKIGS